MSAFLTAITPSAQPLGVLSCDIQITARKNFKIYVSLSSDSLLSASSKESYWNALPAQIGAL